MATRHRLSKHEDLETWTNTDSKSETDLEEDLDLDEADDCESTDIDELRMRTSLKLAVLL